MTPLQSATISLTRPKISSLVSAQRHEGKYHINGALTLAPKEQFQFTLKTCLPLFKFRPDVKKLCFLLPQGTGSRWMRSTSPTSTMRITRPRCLRAWTVYADVPRTSCSCSVLTTLKSAIRFKCLAAVLAEQSAHPPSAQSVISGVRTPSIPASTAWTSSQTSSQILHIEASLFWPKNMGNAKKNFFSQ
jgi:hypothetical protein